MAFDIGDVLKGESLLPAAAIGVGICADRDEHAIGLERAEERTQERAHITAIQDELRPAFSGGVRTAEIWRGLVRFNPSIDESLRDCKPVPQPGGAAACSLTVWTAPRKEPK